MGIRAHSGTPGQPKTKDRAIMGQQEHSVLGGQLTKAFGSACCSRVTLPRINHTNQELLMYNVSLLTCSERHQSVIHVSKVREGAEEGVAIHRR